MNHTDGWMNGWMGGGMWIWTVIGILVVVLLVVAINKLSKNNSALGALRNDQPGDNQRAAGGEVGYSYG